MRRAGKLAYFFASQLDVTIERERLAHLEGENATLTAERAANRARLEFSEESMRLATEAAEVGTWGSRSDYRHPDMVGPDQGDVRHLPQRAMQHG